MPDAFPPEGLCSGFSTCWDPSLLLQASVQIHFVWEAYSDHSIHYPPYLTLYSPYTLSPLPHSHFTFSIVLYCPAYYISYFLCLLFHCLSFLEHTHTHIQSVSFSRSSILRFFCSLIYPSCLRARGEGGDRGWDGRTASPIQWTRVWANSGDSEG